MFLGYDEKQPMRICLVLGTLWRVGLAITPKAGRFSEV